MAGDLRQTAASASAAPAGPRAGAQVLRRRSITPGPKFVPLPVPAGSAPYRRRLRDVLEPAQTAAIDRACALRFHCTGDTGGWRDGRPQGEVAAAMARDLTTGDPAHFFYHLGDIVYPHGEEANYGPQFFSPYADYRAPIFAIPGNHDGEGTDGLRPFVRTFCSPAPPLHDAAVHLPRPVVAQPHVHWTLVHDWVWVIGLYTNVHEDGEVDCDQLTWLTGELRAAPPETIVILAMHRPVYSVDVVHGSNLALGDALDDCFAQADRAPDVVVAGHAHNYQRFSRHTAQRDIPYIVAGSGGFHERHAFGSGLAALPARFPGLPDVTLEAGTHDAFGYLTVTIRPGAGEAVFRTAREGDDAVLDAFAFGPRPAG